MRHSPLPLVWCSPSSRSRPVRSHARARHPAAPDPVELRDAGAVRRTRADAPAEATPTPPTTGRRCSRPITSAAGPASRACTSTSPASPAAGSGCRCSGTDHRGTFDGSVTAEGLRFMRDGVAETAVPGNGDATGLKYLAGKQDCLVVKPGERLLPRLIRGLSKRVALARRLACPPEIAHALRRPRLRFTPDRFAELEPRRVKGAGQPVPGAGRAHARDRQVRVSASLGDLDTWRTLRRATATHVSDGPYAEAKGVVGGCSSSKPTPMRERCASRRCIRPQTWAGRRLGGGTHPAAVLPAGLRLGATDLADRPFVPDRPPCWQRPWATGAIAAHPGSPATAVWSRHGIPGNRCSPRSSRWSSGPR